MATISFCAFDAHSLAAFSGYLLPTARARLLRDDGARLTALGAIWDGLACAAALAEWQDGAGQLLSLFVDPLARRQGIGGRLVELLLAEGVRRGAARLDCGYVLKDGDLEAMDALFRSRGAVISDGPAVFGVESARFKDHALFGQALRPGYRAPAELASFSELLPEQLLRIETAPSLPAFLRPSAREWAVDPELSLVWLREGVPVAFVTGCQSGDTMFDLTGAWRGPDAPEGCLRALILSQVNRCWYRCGGDLRFFLSPVNRRSLRLSEWFTGGDYARYPQRTARLTIPQSAE